METKKRREMKHSHTVDSGDYSSHWEVAECELCGETGRCNENDGLVACQTCQRELLPSGWAL